MLHSQLAKQTVCFEISKHGRLAIKNWLTNNSPGKLTICGEANESSIEDIALKMQGKNLVLIDIEGFEFSLLNPGVITLLKDCQVIIEIHNWVDDFMNKYTKLLKDLDNHFEIQALTHSARDTQSNPFLRSYADDNRLLLASETSLPYAFSQFKAA